MSIHLDKLKPIFLLLVMTVITLCIVFVVNQFKDTSKYVKPVEGAKEVKIVENSVALVSSSDTTVAQRVEEANVEGIVLAGSIGSCKEALKIQSYSVCERSASDSIDVAQGTRSGDMISKDASIILLEAPIPLELLAGSGVKDSNRKLTSTTPVYKPAGEQIDEKLANNILIPGKQIIEYKSWIANRPFSTIFSTIFGNAGKTSQGGEIVVDKTIRNNCEECRNPSNVNPDKSNKISEFMNDSLYRTPGEKGTVKASDAIESCGQNDRFIDWSNNERKMCHMAPPAATIALIKTGITDGIWNKCRGLGVDANGNPIPPGDECMFVEDIIIKIGSVFGSDRECPDGVCVNKFMNTRNKIALSPTSASNYSDKVYAVVNCKVAVAGKPFTVKCAWDISHLFKERKFAEYDDLPDIEKTPSVDSYKNFLEEEASRRSSEPMIEIF